MKKGLSFLIVFAMIGTFMGASVCAQELQVSITDPSATVSYKVLEENLILVSAVDDQDNPVRGLAADDFTIRLADKNAKIISAESLETNKKVGLNVVLVIDNSSSMVNRKAVKPLLAALDAFFKTVRPIDNIHMVFFGKSKSDSITVENQTLNVKIHHSKDIAELRELAEWSFKKGKGLSSKTVLYEAMFAGLNLMRNMPEKENKFMVVFSDGEDINSAFKSETVEAYSKGIPNTEIYCIDFLETAEMDPFLKDFAEDRGGRIWKAKAATELLPIFEAFSSKLLYRYVVSYIFSDPPTGTITLEPAKLDFEMLAATNGSPIGNYVFFESGQSEIPGKYVLIGNKSGIGAFDESKLKTPMDKYLNVLNLVGKRLKDFPEAKAKITGCNTGSGLEKDNTALSEARAKMVKDYLANIWGISPSRLETQARGVPENASASDVPGGSAENRRTEIVIEPADVKAVSPFMAEMSGADKMTVRSAITAEYGVADWNMDIMGGGESLKAMKGADKLEAENSVALDEIDAVKLASLADMTAQIKVTDTNGDAYETKAAAVPITVTKKEMIHDLIQPPRGEAAVSPKSLAFEMLTMTDGSPVSWYVFFEPGKSDIPDTYVKTKSGFDEAALKTALDKYKNVLNIAGKRLADNPDGGITVQGCLSAAEKDDSGLAENRAKAVKDYLVNTWGINSGRIKTEAVGAPQKASKEDVPGGSAENRRAQIVFDSEKLKAENPFVVETNNVSELKVEPAIISGYNLAEWQIDLTVDGQTAKQIKGAGDLEPGYAIPLDEMYTGEGSSAGGHGVAELAVKAGGMGSGGGKSVDTVLKVTDIKGNALDIKAAPVAVTVTKKELIRQMLRPPKGTLAIAPEKLDFEMAAMTDGSPVMNYVFFETGQSAISDKYALYKSGSETKSFDEKFLKTLIERHYNVLNIVGKRLAENADAQVTVIGCNSGAGVEKDNADLSKARADAVKAYLVDTWGINAVRVKTEARNLPEKPSADSVLGGKAENRRAEIVFDSPELQAQSALVVEKSGAGGVAAKPDVTADYGVADWKIDILADGKAIKSVDGKTGLASEYPVALAELGTDNVLAAKAMKAKIALTDKNGDAFEAESGECSISVASRELIHDIVQPPSGSLGMTPENLTIEEITTIDSSPMLNYVFFEPGESELPGRYTLFANTSETAGFDEAKLKGTMEKYQNILNVLGKRLADNPDAPVQIIGCNSNYGKDKGKKLSKARAETVKTYFANIWGIDPNRMTIKARNLPAAPSANRIKEGRAENRRVEIISEYPGILDNIMSTYVMEKGSADEIVITPKITSGYDIDAWKIDLAGGGSSVWTKEGQGDPEAEYKIPLADMFGKIGAFKEVKAEISVTDKKGRAFKSDAACGVKYIKRQERLAQKKGYKVLEKYALILFDYDSDEIKARNKVVVDRIIDRLKKFPDADVKIVGHTDTTGKENYNLKLSERRAKAVHYRLVASGIAAGEKLTYTGVGPYSPLYDNLLPEGRSLNRTVTVYLEYEGKE